METLVTISILTYNRSALLTDLLQSLSGLNYHPLEVIVVDNCSSDNTENIVKNQFESVLYLRTHKNIGASARNIGLRRAAGEIIISLDDDIAGINDYSIAKLTELFKGCPALGAVNFKILDESSGKICNWVHHRKLEKYHNKEFWTYEITEGAVAFRKSALEVAGYYPDYFFLSHEGPDLAFRILNNGYRVIYSDAVCVVHSHSGLGRKNWINYYYDTRNQLWLVARNFPLSYALRYLLRGIPSMLFYSLRDGFFLYWAKGILDGLKGLRTALKDRNVLRRETMKIIRKIDSGRPDLRYLLKKKLSQKKIRLLS